MFYQLEITIINHDMKLRFTWQKEPEERIIVRNKLTKNEYFNRPCTDMMRRNGIGLVSNGIPRNVPLEVVSRKRGREDVVYSVTGSTPYCIYYQISNQQGSVIMDVQMPPEITEEMEEYLPEDIIYFDLITPDEARIPLYLPKLGAGNNRFWFTDPGVGCRIDFNNPRLNEGKDNDESLSGIFKLINGYPQQGVRRGYYGNF